MEANKGGLNLLLSQLRQKGYTEEQKWLSISIVLEGIHKTSELTWGALSPVFNHTADLYMPLGRCFFPYSALGTYRVGSRGKTLAQSSYCIALLLS